MSADKDNSFITEHFALVHSIAGRFRNRGIEYDELFSAGCVGLVKAPPLFHGKHENVRIDARITRNGARL